METATACRLGSSGLAAFACCTPSDEIRWSRQHSHAGRVHVQWDRKRATHSWPSPGKSRLICSLQKKVSKAGQQSSELQMTRERQGLRCPITPTIVQASAADPSVSSEKPRNATVRQWATSVALSMALALGSVAPTYALGTPLASTGLQDSVITLLDASKDSASGKESAEKIVAKAEEVKEKAAKAIETAKQKQEKIQEGAATLIEAAKDSPGGKREAERVVRKAEELKKRTAENVSRTVKSATKMQQGAALLAEAAQLDAPGVDRGVASTAGSDRGKDQEKSSSNGASEEKEESSESSSGSSGGFVANVKSKIEGAKEGIKKVPAAFNRGTEKAVKDEAPAGVETGVRNAVKEGVAGTVKEGINGAVTGGPAGGATGALMGAAKGVVKGATQQ